MHVSREWPEKENHVRGRIDVTVLARVGRGDAKRALPFIKCITKIGIDSPASSKFSICMLCYSHNPKVPFSLQGGKLILI